MDVPTRSRAFLVGMLAFIPILIGAVCVFFGLTAAKQSDNAWFGFWDDLAIDPAALGGLILGVGFLCFGLGACLAVLADRGLAKRDAEEAAEEEAQPPPL